MYSTTTEFKISLINPFVKEAHQLSRHLKASQIPDASRQETHYAVRIPKACRQLWTLQTWSSGDWVYSCGLHGEQVPVAVHAVRKNRRHVDVQADPIYCLIHITQTLKRSQMWEALSRTKSVSTWKHRMTWLICMNFSSGDKAENIKKRHLLTNNDEKRLILQNILSFRDMSLIRGFDVQCKNIFLNLMWTSFTSKKTDWKLAASLTSASSSEETPEVYQRLIDWDDVVTLQLEACDTVHFCLSASFSQAQGAALPGSV